MSLLTLLGRWWDNRGTAILGSASSIVAGLVVIPDLVAPGNTKYWAAANVVLGVLTISRSNRNRKTIAKESQ